MTVVLTIAFAILFFALIMASIALHEVGHLIPAKLFGVKVTQYFVGFGKTLWSTRRGETEYGFELEKPLWLFNPGAAEESCFGCIEIDANGRVMLSHGRLR